MTFLVNLLVGSYGYDALGGYGVRGGGRWRGARGALGSLAQLLPDGRTDGGGCPLALSPPRVRRTWAAAGSPGSPAGVVGGGGGEMRAQEV